MTNIYDSNSTIDIDTYEPFFKLNNSIIVGDFNAHHTMWGHRNNNQKGSSLVKLIEKYDFVLMNNKSATRMDRRSTSILDLTLISKELAAHFSWENTFNSLNSDHNLIKISAHCNDDNTDIPQDIPKWNLKKLIGNYLDKFVKRK